MTKKETANNDRPEKSDGLSRGPQKIPPIINAHSHVFTARHVPPLLAKRFVPFPFYYLVHLDVVIGFYKFLKEFKGLAYSNWHRAVKRFLYFVSVTIRRNFLLALISWILGAWLSILTFYYIYDFLIELTNTSGGSSWLGQGIEWLRELMSSNGIFPKKPPILLKIAIALFVFVFVKSGRNLIIFLFKKMFTFFKVLPGKETKKLIERYMLIAKFAVYKKQTTIFSKMKEQYPRGSGFVLLPMDMKYMGAGRVKDSYLSQLKELQKIKISSTYKKQGVGVYPFVFVDPRRIRDDKKPKSVRISKGHQLFNFSTKGHKVILEECIIKTYMEDHGFNGFKIYPAIGYYPFEKELLPLWKYAVDNEIPIMSHCIKGTIFYRGRKKREWDEHWVFKDEETKNQLLLPEVKNIDFQRNFTHPMNFLCLLEEPLLRVLIGHYDDQQLKDLFGYKGPDSPMDKNLNGLKICLAHYGGEDQWKRYLEKDSYGYIQQIIKAPGTGIKFIKTQDDTDKIDYDRLAQLWKYVDWYSIISSMMMQYPNVYADISYILHDPSIFPLLKETLKPKYGKLRERVLYGTDFYVVRNHNSEKELFVSSDFLLEEQEFNRIARLNPKHYLS
ncbi:hypothetical protein GTQ34_14570 [Muricauda sp. JGD-17]|uniref:Amidohydrolase-related domain-containing protein n=1 Tax=Flagellimonas ochracea TaxID=2696472 RepID=A0A964TE36_9FLAO|nr:hypothetical protein [Allomuricauda ochracea]NAY93137.1 hypothetical protein [Allomuricauda ochracea]